MTLKIFPVSPTTMGATTVDPAMNAIERFENNLHHCIAEWNSGSSAAAFEGNIQELFGGSLGKEYFERQLGLAVGQSVKVLTDGHVTFVQTLPQEPQPDSLKRATVIAQPVTEGEKNPPRPMNCWLLYRDTKYKELKDQYPYLTVQQISTICSEEWKNLPIAEKDHWKAMAKLAKDEHQRLFPGYKYTPRKPGQKKKRQSRKAAQIAADAAAATTTLDLFDFNPFPDMPMSAPDTNSTYAAVTNAITTNISYMLTSDADQLAEAMDLSGTESLESMPVISFHGAESLRQERLEAEFGDSFSDEDNEAFAFRAGVDENITLPSFYSGVY